MHVAYADENFHLAKILLLRLKGIEVTGDSDPRIDEVTDEDFASAFVPRGRFKLDEETQKRCLEGQRRERERLRRRAREDRLRKLEHVWERSLRCLREEKARVARRREEECRVRRRAEIEAREREREAREREKEKELAGERRREVVGPAGIGGEKSSSLGGDADGRASATNGQAVCVEERGREARRGCGCA